MGDVGDYWRDVKEANAAARRERQKNATDALDRLRSELGVLGIVLLTPAETHWQFLTKEGRLVGDYWPTTQKARPSGGSTHHGVTLTQIVSWVKNRA